MTKSKSQNKVHILKQKVRILNFLKFKIEKGDTIDLTDININLFKILKEPKRKKSFFQVKFIEIKRHICHNFMIKIVYYEPSF